ncbi:MAG: cyclic nucleotide-binding domain-containing protein [Chloroflexi bacterium]|nr:cyclic nucleotide-binding domain-containing protein [Chloroflexota bacterium]
MVQEHVRPSMAVGAGAAAIAAPAGPASGAEHATAATIDAEFQQILALAANPSPNLRSWVERAKGAAILTDLTEPQLAAILAPGEFHRYQPGDTVIKYGDTSDSMFALLAEGRVRIVAPIELPPPVGDWLSGEKSLIELPAPQVVGHFNLLASTTRSATVEALTELDAVEVQKAHLERICRVDLTVGYLLMRNMARSLQGQVRFLNADIKNLTVAVALAARALKK